MLVTCLFCRFKQTALETAGGEKWRATFLSAVRHREAFHKLMVHRFRLLLSSFLIDALSSTYREQEREKKRNGQGSFFPRQTWPVGCTVPGFSQWIGANKSCFKVSP
jgi:hypothetical protein